MSDTVTERLAEALRGHIHERDQDDPSLWSMYCSCGECVYTCHPDKQWLYRAHLTAALAPVVDELVAEAWDMGYCAGKADQAFRETAMRAIGFAGRELATQTPNPHRIEKEHGDE